MLEYLSISKTKPSFPAYLDFQSLRRIGIDRVQQLSSKLWTDYNLHDPGVTILEVLCYAITDLGYRNNIKIEDLLALNLKDANSQEYNFFTPDRLLSCNPVTELDFRKRLIEIPGVRNAWLERLGVVDSAAVPPQQVENYEPAVYVDRVNGVLQYRVPVGQSEQTALRLNPQGLYRVCLDLESDRFKDANGQSYRPRAEILAEVKRVLCSHRNLCEDFGNVVVLGEEEIGLCTEIELEASADPEDVLVEIYVRVQAFLSPRLRFYTLSELLDRGKSPAEIFAGRPSALYDPTSVYRSNGFIDTAELAALNLPQVIHTSDLYQIIMDVAGVAAIKKLSIVNYINGLPQSTGDPWCLHLTPKHRPVLGLAQSKVTFSKGNLPFKASADEVERRYYEQQAAGIKSPLDRSELDLAVPQGTHYDLADHYSIHHDFPLTYGISEDGLPGTASVLRQGQANQLKGYLVFFDQILANYFAQLAHVRDLFSWESEVDRQQPIDDIQKQNRQRTYFTQRLTTLPGVEEILLNYLDTNPRSSGEMPIGYLPYLDFISEDAIAYFDRRNRFLDHLLARFAETFSDYVQLNYQLNGGRRQEIDIIEDKARFLREYPELSRDRFRAFNYCNCDQIWDTNNVSGYQKRVSRLLGTDLDPDRHEKFWRRSLNHYQIIESALGYKFSLTIDPDTSPLQSKQTYHTLAQAQSALDEFLVFALDPAHYRRLTYHFYYHYGWEVIDATGKSLVTYDRQFPSQSARTASLSPLLAELGGGNATVELATDTAGLVGFKLTIAIIDKPAQIFTSILKYPTAAAARTAAATAQVQIKDRGAYRGIRIGAAPESPTLFTYYGYGVIDDRGNLLAESDDSERVATVTLRDRQLNRWLSSIGSNRNKLTIAGAAGSYHFYLEIPNAAKTHLHSLNQYPTEELAGQAATAIGEHLRYLSRYALQSPGLSITDESGNPIATTDVALDPVEVFTLLNQIDPLLQIEPIPGTKKRKIAGYRFKLVDRQGEILLVGTQTQPNEDAARSHFYRDVLSILCESGVIASIGNDADSPLSFQVVSLQTPTQILATHPHNYPSATERDTAIDRLKLQVRTARLLTEFPEQPPAYIGIIKDGTGQILLQETQRHHYAPTGRENAKTAACQAGNTIVELAQTRDNFRSIDAEDGSGTYSWELTNRSKDRILAVPPQTFASQAERDRSIAAIQAQINEEGFHVVEHILLRPKYHPPAPAISDNFLPISKDSPIADPSCCATVYDPYSFWISIIIPYWPTRFRNLNFRQLVERTLRLEAPAHVGLKICWIDVCQMAEFETAYKNWLEQIDLDACNSTATDRTGSLNRLLAILTTLKNVYPEGTLHDCDEGDPNDNPIVLDRTALGTEEIQS
jgi:hypothetical protein